MQLTLTDYIEVCELIRTSASAALPSLEKDILDEKTKRSNENLRVCTRFFEQYALQPPFCSEDSHIALSTKAIERILLEKNLNLEDESRLKKIFVTLRKMEIKPVAANSLKLTSEDGDFCEIDLIYLQYSKILSDAIAHDRDLDSHKVAGKHVSQCILFKEDRPFFPPLCLKTMNTLEGLKAWLIDEYNFNHDLLNSEPKAASSSQIVSLPKRRSIISPTDTITHLIDNYSLEQCIHLLYTAEYLEVKNLCSYLEKDIKKRILQNPKLFTSTFKKFFFSSNHKIKDLLEEIKIDWVNANNQTDLNKEMCREISEFLATSTKKTERKDNEYNNEYDDELGFFLARWNLDEAIKKGYPQGFFAWASQLYEEKKYEEAIDVLNKLENKQFPFHNVFAPDQPKNGEINFLKGKSYIKLSYEMEDAFDIENAAENYKKGIHFYKKAAHQGYLLSYLHLAHYYHVHKNYDAEAIECFEYIATSNKFPSEDRAETSLILAKYYNKLNPNPQKAFAYSLINAETDFPNPYAIIHVANCYFLGNDVEKDLEKAFLMFLKANNYEVEKDIKTEILLILGQFLIGGVRVDGQFKQDLIEGFKYLVMAKNNGNKKAIDIIEYEKLHGTDQEKKALMQVEGKSSKEEIDIDAVSKIHEVDELLLSSIEAERSNNLPLAIELSKAAYNNGNVEAGFYCYTLLKRQAHEIIDILHITGHKPAQADFQKLLNAQLHVSAIKPVEVAPFQILAVNRAQAMPPKSAQPNLTYERLQKESAEGDNNSKYQLAILLSKGSQNVKKNLDEAIKLFKELVVLKEFEKARFGLAVCLSERGRDEDIGLAIENYTPSADSGNKISQYELGLLYERSNNREEAFKWYKMAADKSKPGKPCKNSLYKLAQKAYEENQISEAKELATEAHKQGQKDGGYLLFKLLKKESLQLLLDLVALKHAQALAEHAKLVDLDFIEKPKKQKQKPEAENELFKVGDGLDDYFATATAVQKMQFDNDQNSNNSLSATSMKHAGAKRRNDELHASSSNDDDAGASSSSSSSSGSSSSARVSDIMEKQEVKEPSIKRQKKD